MAARPAAGPAGVAERGTATAAVTKARLEGCARAKAAAGIAETA